MEGTEHSLDQQQSIRVYPFTTRTTTTNTATCVKCLCGGESFVVVVVVKKKKNNKSDNKHKNLKQGNKFMLYQVHVS